MDSLPQPELTVINVGRTVIDGIAYPLEVKLTPYKYEPLQAPNAIRVLILHSRDKAVQVSDGILPLCQLIDTTLGEYPYLAVSYAWGSLDDYRTLPLSGNKFINVTKSLYALICRLCPEDGTLPIWADQTCINQRDKDERSMQVQLMNDIYAQAAGMSIWLGESDATTQSAVELMKRLDCPDFDLREINKFRAERSRSELEEALARNDIELGPKEPGWSAIRRLSERAWFSRLWAFQEAIVPKGQDFLCGPHNFSLFHVYRAFTVAIELGAVSSTAYNNVYSTFLHRMKYREGRTHLMDLLRDTSNNTWECTDVRDRVYAIIGLQSRDDPCGITVDYSRPIQTVFEDTANAITRNRATLNILYRPYSDPSSDLPSWLPDWHTDYFSMAINDDPPQTMFDCCKGLNHVFENAPPGHLKVKGKVVARVSEIMAHRFVDHPFGRDYESVWSYMGVSSLLPALQAKFEQYSWDAEDGKVSKTAYLNWLLSTTLSRGYYRDMNAAEFSTGERDSPADLAALLLTQNPFGVFMMCKCDFRRIAVLDCNSFTIALAPGGAQVDDVICVLNGANVPIVLRRRGTEFEFVGDCYIHGIMYGEAVTWSQQEGDCFDLI